MVLAVERREGRASSPKGHVGRLRLCRELTVLVTKRMEARVQEKRKHIDGVASVRGQFENSHAIEQRGE